MTNDERNRAARLRRKLNKLGYTMKKTNCRRNSIDNFGGYAIIDTACNAIVRGSRFDLALMTLISLFRSLNNPARGTLRRPFFYP